MRAFLCICLFFAATGFNAAQKNDDDGVIDFQEDPIADEPGDEVDVVETPVTNDLAGKKRNLRQVAGFAWGTKYERVKEQLKRRAADGQGEILHDADRAHILFRNRGIVQRYQFYRNDERYQINTGDDTGQKNLIYAKFFLLETRLRMTRTSLVLKKIRSKYGRSTHKTGTPMRGAYIWSLTEGIIIQTYERFDGKAYTRRVFYLSSALRKEINIDLPTFQWDAEIKALNKLIP